MSGYCPEPSLSDPFYQTVEIAAEASATNFTVYGVGLRDLYRRQPGVSYSRLATTLYAVGFSAKQAWQDSHEVEVGKTLLIIGKTGGSKLGNERDHLRAVFKEQMHVALTEFP